MRAASVMESPTPLTHFATTRWSLIRQRFAPADRSGIDPGLAQLCQIYWRPIFTFIYRRGYSAPDAQDLTQDFFLMLLEGKLLESADPERGRFRSLLLRSLKNFLIDAAVKRRRHKRGGQVQFVSWEKWMADAPPQLSIPSTAVESCAPESLFDAGWAAAIAEEALRRLRLECESKGRRRVYEVLHKYLTADRGETSYEQLSRALGVPEPSIKSLLHHFRTRYRTLLREEIAKTVESEANVDEEIRYLCATLSAAKG
ncbi:MAG TPA: sigma-70 family RNA polymerase sigma factor [Chthoniobacterales bacterium]|nr:sigma-70 family RNA polymerase sigma factor [Chthoniobacterales bacterium]